jgi:hypothetical protein
MQLATSPHANVQHAEVSPMKKMLSISSTSLNKQVSFVERKETELNESQDLDEDEIDNLENKSETKDDEPEQEQEQEPAESTAAVAASDSQTEAATEAPAPDIRPSLIEPLPTIPSSGSVVEEEVRRPRSDTLTSTRSNFSSFSQRYHEEESVHSMAFKIVRSAFMTQPLLLQFFEESYPVGRL